MGKKMTAEKLNQYRAVCAEVSDLTARKRRLERRAVILSDTVRRVVGSPSQLREWAMMEPDTVQSVVASNFQRSYRSRAASEKEFAALPEAGR